MATNKTTSAQKSALAPLSFEDAYGGTVSIPHGEVRNYASCRAEQLTSITQTLAASRQLGLPQSAIDAFHLMANEYAHVLEQLVDLVAEDEANSAKGGVQ
jgi:hypothetical protein